VVLQDVKYSVSELFPQLEFHPEVIVEPL